MRQGQASAPFLAAVLQQSGAGGQAFHTPGHKGGRAGDAEWRGHAAGALPLDLDPPALPVPGTPGAVAAPWELVRAAEGLLAELYGAGRSFFLVNGATAGLQALLLATVSGSSLLLPRTAHRSVVGALALAGARPEYLPATLDSFWGLPTAPRLPTPNRFPAVQAVLATYPDYYGLACDLAGWRNALVAGTRSRAAGAGPGQGGAVEVPLLVDEAHGPHLPFLPESGATGELTFPRPALELGADAVVQSPHKLLGSLVQSAWLHLSSGRPSGRSAVDPGRVEAALATLTTTSPSFLLLASLDATRRWAAAEGRGVYRRLAGQIAEIRAKVAALPGLRLLDAAEAARLGYVALDPLKLTVSVRELGLSGPEAEAFLRWRGLSVELADPFNLLFVLSAADTPESLQALVEGLQALARAATRPADRERLVAGRPSLAVSLDETAALLAEVMSLPPTIAVSPREALLGHSEAVPLDRAAGRVASRAVGLYPPGIPLVAPGEVCSDAHVETLRRLRSAGLRVEGLSHRGDYDEPCLEVMK